MPTTTPTACHAPPRHPPHTPAPPHPRPARLPLPAGKFLFLYKRAAHRVVLSPTGDLIVRPSLIERSAKESFHTSLQQHLLGEYGRRWGRKRWTASAAECSAAAAAAAAVVACMRWAAWVRMLRWSPDASHSCQPRHPHARLPAARSFAALIRGQFVRRKEHNQGRRGCEALLQCE